jgi:hypothetical protein
MFALPGLVGYSLPIIYIINQFQNLIQSYKKKWKHNKIVKNEFLAVEDISSRDVGKVRYDMFVKNVN